MRFTYLKQADFNQSQIVLFALGHRKAPPLLEQRAIPSQKEAIQFHVLFDFEKVNQQFFFPKLFTKRPLLNRLLEQWHLHHKIIWIILVTSKRKSVSKEKESLKKTPGVPANGLILFIVGRKIVDT